MNKPKRTNSFDQQAKDLWTSKYLKIYLAIIFGLIACVCLCLVAYLVFIGGVFASNY